MLRVREKRADDAELLAGAWTANYGAPVIVARGRKYDPVKLDGFVAEEDSELLGAVTYARLGGEIEVITLDSLMEDRGAGTALLEAVVALTRGEGAARICLVTGNDNIRAIRFYQKRGWNLCAIHADAITQARKLKPEIPLTGDHGIPIRHEIEFELRLA